MVRKCVSSKTGNNKPFIWIFVSESDNSMNEIITCEENKELKLGLKMTMNSYGNTDITDSKVVISEI